MSNHQLLLGKNHDGENPERTQSLLAIDNEIAGSVPPSDRPLKTYAAASWASQKSSQLTSGQTAPTDTIDEDAIGIREELPCELEIACDNFRDNALNVYYDIQEYAALRGAKIMDECNFGDFMNFCEDIAEIPRLRRQSLQTDMRGKENLMDDTDALDPY